MSESSFAEGIINANNVGLGGNKLGGSKLSIKKSVTNDNPNDENNQSALSAVAKQITTTNLQSVVTSETYNPTVPTSVPLDQIWREEIQVRLVHVDNSVEKLSESIKEIGLQQPIVVRAKQNPKNPNQTYCIVAGHTRFKAFQLLKENDSTGKFDKIPTIKINISDRKLLELQFAENEQRYPLLPIEVARALAVLFKEYKINEPHLELKQFILKRQVKYPNNFVSMVRIIHKFNLMNEFIALEWFGYLNIKQPNLTDNMLKLFDSLITKRAIGSFLDFKYLISKELANLGLENQNELDSSHIRQLIEKIKTKKLGIEKKPRAKKDPDILNLSSMDDYKNLITNGSMDSLGATVQHTLKESSKQDVGALLKAIAERIGEDELGEMLFTHLQD